MHIRLRYVILSVARMLCACVGYALTLYCSSDQKDLVDLVNLEMDLGVRVRGKLNGSHTPNESYGARHWYVCMRTLVC